MMTNEEIEGARKEGSKVIVDFLEKYKVEGEKIQDANCPICEKPLSSLKNDDFVCSVKGRDGDFYQVHKDCIMNSSDISREMHFSPDFLPEEVKEAIHDFDFDPSSSSLSESCGD